MPKKFIIEFGTGIDLHGKNQTKAATRAIKNAISTSTLVGLREIVNFDPKSHRLFLKVKIAAPNPEEIHTDTLRESISITDDILFEVEKGGMIENGNDQEDVDKDEIIVVNAAVTVYVETINETH